MRLKWGKSEFGILKKEFENSSFEKALNMETEALLNLMENINQLMYDYEFCGDMKNLETVMRKQNQFLEICRKRNERSVSFYYLDMSFLRLDAKLYLHFGKNRQAADCAGKNLEAANICFAQLVKSSTLSEEQKLFVGFSCVEVYKEAAAAFDTVMDNKNALRCSYEAYHVLEWLKPYFKSADGIHEQVAEIYAMIAHMMYQNQNAEEGRTCYGRAISIFRELDTKCRPCRYYFARGLWMLSAYGVAEAVFSGEEQFISECEIEAEEFLKEENLNETDLGIAKGALGMAIWQKGLLTSQALKVEESIAWLEKSSVLLKDSLAFLENTSKSLDDARKNIVRNISANIFGIYLGLLHNMGSQYYCAGQTGQAQDKFLELLRFLANSKQYKTKEFASALVRADTSFYLALIYADFDTGKAEFYALQSVEESEKLGKISNNTLAWGICIRSSCVLSDLYLNKRDKEKSFVYAEKGIYACDALNALDNQNENLVMRDKLIRNRKKAARRFF